jgi:putative flippase GtrA
MNLKQRVSKSFLKYIGVGIVAFGVEYGSFYALYLNAKWPLYFANSISFGLGLLTSFLLNRLWTFGGKNYQKKAAHQLSFYIALALINLLLTNVFIGVLEKIGTNPRIGKLVAMVITSLWNYFLFKALIFTHRRKPDDTTFPII